MRVLAVSDEVDEGLWHDVDAGRGVDLIVACGDLPFEYLAHLTTALDAPLVFVPGNHDPDVAGYRQARNGLIAARRAARPSRRGRAGAVNADGHVVDVGRPAHRRPRWLPCATRDGPNQYTPAPAAPAGPAAWPPRPAGAGGATVAASTSC